MAVGVTIDSQAWTDPRFEIAGVALGIHRDDALIRVAKIWSWQTEHYTEAEPTYAVSEVVIIGYLGPKGPEALIAAHLARAEGATFYICGSRGRIEWFWRNRNGRTERARKGGEARRDREAAARAAGIVTRAGGRFVSPTANAQAGGPAGGGAGATAGGEVVGSWSQGGGQLVDAPANHQPVTSLPPASHQLGTTSPPPIRARSSSSLPPVSPAPVDRGLLTRARERLNEARAAVDPTSQPLPLMGGQPEADLVARLRETPEVERLARLDHAIDVLAAEAVRDNDVGDLRLAQLGSERAWQRLQAASATSAANTRRRGGAPGGGNGRGGGGYGGGGVAAVVAAAAAIHGDADTAPADPEAPPGEGEPW